MAKTKSFPEVGVTVVVNGKELTEHEDSELPDSDNEVTRYVEAETDQIFQVHLHMRREVRLDDACLVYQISVDGKRVDDQLVQGDQIRYTGYLRISEGYELGDSKVKKYRFASLQLDDGSKLTAPVGDLGTIKVEAYHKHRLRIVPFPDYSAATKSTDALSEKALKGEAVSHTVAFSEPAKCIVPKMYWETAFIPGNEAPAAVWNFRYRSIEALKSMLIIRSDTPADGTTPAKEDERAEQPANDDLEGLTADELRALLRRSMAAEGERETKREIKREHPEDEPRRRKHRQNEKTTIELDDDGNVVSETTAKIPVNAEGAIEIDG